MSGQFIITHARGSDLVMRVVNLVMHHALERFRMISNFLAEILLCRFLLEPLQRFKCDKMIFDFMQRFKNSMCICMFKIGFCDLIPSYV